MAVGAVDSSNNRASFFSVGSELEVMAQVRQKLNDTAIPLGDPFYYGDGVIDVYTATH